MTPRDPLARPAGPPRSSGAFVAFASAVHRAVRRVPRGRVVTYGQVAAMVGYPRHARMVGAAMRACPSGVPWHRVVNAQGGISARARVSGMVTQRILLEQEGVRLRGGRVALRAVQWRGAGGGARSRAAARVLEEA